MASPAHPAAITEALSQLTPGDRFFGLRYVTDTQPGFTRRKAGDSWQYLDPDGKPVTDEAIRQRLDRLAIPPAYTGVWICRDSSGHLQATGRDERGRKQYLYHPRWHEIKDAVKFDRMLRFGDSLPAIRRTVARHLSRQDLTRSAVLAAIVRLMDRTSVRVGNAEYARQNGSYGVTTIRRKHTKVAGSIVRFEFTGKGGKDWNVELRDRHVARIVRQCQDLPGYQIFKYLDADGALATVDSSDVNLYLKEVSGEEFTAKDFRTWSGTVAAWRELLACPACASNTAARKAIAGVMKSVAAILGNTPAVCRKSYVHPGIVDAYTEGKLEGYLAAGPVAPVEGMDETEASLLRFLRLQGEN